MLKKQEYVYETSNYKIINPNKKQIETIKNEMIKFQKENGDVDFDNDKLNHYLFKTLVEFQDSEFDFKKYSLEEFIDILVNGSKDIETIAFYIGSLVSDIIINDLREKQLEIKIANIELLKTTTMDSLNSFQSDLIQIERNKKRIQDEKRINKIRNKRRFDENIEIRKLNFIQRFLYKHGLIN